jgi:hypothetical protein
MITISLIISVSTGQVGPFCAKSELPGKVFMKHSYPQDLSYEISRLWDSSMCPERPSEKGNLPDHETLEYLISTCYQASMMHEELRSLQFRVILCGPSAFPEKLGPPHGFLRLVFSEPRAFHEHELVKLSPASEFENSLIGVHYTAAEGLEIWGLINSGTRWIQAFRGGSKLIIPLPDALVLDVTGPGSIRAYRSSNILAQLSGGRIIMPHSNVLYSRWVAQRTSDFQDEIMEAHSASRSNSDEAWATVSRGIISRLNEQVIKRIISSIRNKKHGGTIITFPRSFIQTISSPNPHIFIKYLFRDDDPVRRLRTLIVDIMNELAKQYGACGDPIRVVGWNEYVASNHETLLDLDEALFEYARFVANLAAVDGAVVFAKGLELIGFGGVIKGAFGREDLIARAMDVEGEARVYEIAEGVGTRHLAAYHICKEIQDVLAIVISQDGNTRIVKWMNGYITFWDLLPITIAGPEPP